MSRVKKQVAGGVSNVAGGIYALGGYFSKDARADGQGPHATVSRAESRQAAPGEAAGANGALKEQDSAGESLEEDDKFGGLQKKK